MWLAIDPDRPFKFDGDRKLIQFLTDGIVGEATRSKLEGAKSVLEIRLITGERLVFDGDAKKFGVKKAKLM